MNQLHLYLSHLEHNYTVIRNKIRPTTQLFGVVKANAYGSALAPIAKRLVELGVDKLAVASTEEGTQLRDYGIKTPILVFYPQIEKIPELLKADLEPCVYSDHYLNQLAAALNSKSIQNYPIHLKFNTGLNRIGFAPEAVEMLIQKTNQSCFKVESIYSHLAASEDRPSIQCDFQIERFKQIKATYEKVLTNPPYFHLLNSSGVFNYPEYEFDAVRCGIALHGYANKPEWDALLKPVAALKAQITQIHSVKKGEAIGYNSGWVAPAETRIATLPLGHADGIGRHFGNQKGTVVIKGQKAPIIGNVCMDMLMVEVGNIPCEEGDEVTFFGPMDQSAEEFAQQGKTISYELLAGLGPRIKRLLHS